MCIVSFMVPLLNNLSFMLSSSPLPYLLQCFLCIFISGNFGHPRVILLWYICAQCVDVDGLHQISSALLVFSGGNSDQRGIKLCLYCKYGRWEDHASRHRTQLSILIYFIVVIISHCFNNRLLEL